LIVALHGLGSNPQQIIRYPKLTDLAEKHGYIVVAPMGYNSGGWYGLAIPAFLKGKDAPANLSELSEKDVLNVLDIVRKDYSIDAERIYLMGHSMGGGGTWHLGIKYPDIWAGLAPIAPATFDRPAKDVEKIKHIPVILVQGDKDVLCPVATARKWADEMKKLNMTHKYEEVKDGNHISIVDRIPLIIDFFNEHKRKPMEKKDK
jgi:predicted peptidase